ncbi:RagB/SusD family nutrient uptake outer membrane protein [Chitinophaga sp.]|uniref:RagB/SusD family nutrient uptake outer membrane protein n=1 Tax=Chitinophaga sp. TaxID=1869181 RepID=UPI00262A3868|nr:RagB/SusD family nutrient uptake outer membrane protein [uncultured Chitinophaga sp.]
MKRTLRNISLALGTTLLFGACTDLDVSPTTELPRSIFWKSEKDADFALTGIYNYLLSPGGNWACSQYQIYAWDAYTDDAYTQHDYGGGRTVGSSGLTPNTKAYVESYYTNNYKAIAAANHFLANVDKVISGDKLKQYKAEAHFMRAFNYFWLAKLYGNVPITKADPFTLDYNSVLAKSTRAEVLAFVKEDLDIAIAGLPDVPYGNGHAVKGTAQGYKVRVLLFEKKFAEAAALAKEIIDGKKFSLNDNYAANFYKPGQNSSPEIMFSVKYLLPNIPHQDAPLAATTFAWKGYLGTQDLINEYEANDPRKTMTWFFPGDDVNEGWPYTGDLAVATPGKGGWIEGYYAPKKWLTPGIVNPSSGTLDDNDFVLLRFADIKLMYAEAQNEAVGPDASVYTQINEVRDRPGVNMPGLPAGLNQAQMRERIRKERRVEFALEGHRYFDLRRWGIAEQKLNGFATNPLAPNIKLKYEAKYEFWPIPQTEIDRNTPALKQNPDY